MEGYQEASRRVAIYRGRTAIAIAMVLFRNVVSLSPFVPRPVLSAVPTKNDEDNQEYITDLF